jgi:hypothetical protein
MVRALSALGHPFFATAPFADFSRLRAGVRAIKLQQDITEGRLTVPLEQNDGEEMETFLDETTSEPRPHLCKETTMTEEEKAAMKQKATAKMQAVRWRDPQPLPSV